MPTTLLIHHERPVRMAFEASIRLLMYSPHVAIDAARKHMVIDTNRNLHAFRVLRNGKSHQRCRLEQLG